MKKFSINETVENESLCKSLLKGQIFKNFLDYYSKTLI